MVKSTTEPSGSPKFFDIAPPGKIAPPATTRPVIVGNKPQQVDRMVNVAAEPAPTTAPAETSSEPTLTEPAPQPASEQPAALPQVVTHQARKVRTARWLWLVPAVILIIIILDLLQHYGKL